MELPEYIVLCVFFDDFMELKGCRSFPPFPGLEQDLKNLQDQIKEVVKYLDDKVDFSRDECNTPNPLKSWDGHDRTRNDKGNTIKSQSFVDASIFIRICNLSK